MTQQHTYRDHIIVENKSSVDLVDRTTGKWVVCRTVRQARWKATVWATLKHAFGLTETLPVKFPN